MCMGELAQTGPYDLTFCRSRKLVVKSAWLTSALWYIKLNVAQADRSKNWLSECNEMHYVVQCITVSLSATKLN